MYFEKYIKLYMSDIKRSIKIIITPLIITGVPLISKEFNIYL